MKIIKVFSTPTCHYCHLVKDYLKEKNVEFEDIDVSVDYEGATAMVEKTGMRAVPQIWIDDEVVVGFDREQLDKLLN